MSGCRSDIEASVGPGREGLVGGAQRLLVRVRLFDCGLDQRQPDAYCDLRPAEARQLALQLLAAAQDAEWQTDQAGLGRQTR